MIYMLPKVVDIVGHAVVKIIVDYLKTRVS